MGQDAAIDPCTQVGKCVFCGHTDLAESRIWPDWLDRIIPKSSYHPIGDVAAAPSGADALSKPFVQRPRLACSACNDGWIANLSDQVRQFLVPALQGDQVTLGPQQAKVLSGWLCLLAINAAFLTKDCGISPGDRTFLRYTGRPPRNWSIFVAGLHQSDWSGSCTHHPYRIEFAGNPTATRSRGTIRQTNTRLMSFGMGPLFFHIFTSPSLLFMSEFDTELRRQGLTQLCPQDRRFGLLPPKPVMLPPDPRLTDQQAWAVTDRFAGQLRQRLAPADAKPGKVFEPAL